MQAGGVAESVDVLTMVSLAERRSGAAMNFFETVTSVTCMTSASVVLGGGLTGSYCSSSVSFFAQRPSPHVVISTDSGNAPTTALPAGELP
jgi:hypothetical protein